MTDSLAVIAPAETAIGPPRRAGRCHVNPPYPPDSRNRLTYPMRRRIPTAHVPVARTAPTIHRMRLGSRSASAIRTHAAARSTAVTCDQDARNRDPDTRATRTWIFICGRSGCAVRETRPGWARRGARQGQQVPGPAGAEGRHQGGGADLRDAEEPFEIATDEEVAVELFELADGVGDGEQPAGRGGHGATPLSLDGH